LIRETEVCDSVRDVLVGSVDDTETPALDVIASAGLSPDDVIKKIGTEHGLNEQQWIAFQIIAKHFVRKHVIKCVEESEQLTMLMTGPGGTGKTHIIKAVRAVMQYYGCGHMIRLLAPTGSAAALIDGLTVHRGLGITIKSKNKGKGNRDPGESNEDYAVIVSVRKWTQLREEWKNVMFLLIDEVSLVSLQLLAEIDHALRFAKEKPDQWFGGIAVIFSGDFYQYPPVGGSALYVPISVYSGQSDDEICKRLGQLAWKTVNTVVGLTEQQRMKNDVAYSNAVCRLHVRRCTFEDMELFNSRLIKGVDCPDGVDMGSADNYSASAIVATNALREAINAHKAEVSCGEGRLVSCYALDKCSHKVLNGDARRKLIQLDMAALRSTQTLLGCLPLYVGMPVILRLRNLSTDLGITNRSQGFVRRISTEKCPNGLTYATCVIVYFPSSKVQLSDLAPGHFPITPVSWTFTTLLQGLDGALEKL
jgi:hypothetical protein